MTPVRRVSAALVLLGVALAVTACDSGPADVSAGSYRAFAASPEVGAVPVATLTLSNDAVALTAGGSTTRASVGPGDEEYVLCPPDGTGTPSPITGTLTLGTTTITRPALFGDCGQTKPQRVTIVDLDSLNQEAGPMPFTRWVEFCNVADADCP